MISRMLRVLALAIASLVAASLARAQSQSHFVLTELPGAPVALVLAVDPVTGVAQPLPGFASDTLSPLALTQDRFDGDLLVALDEGSGTSRVIRLHRFAGTYLEFPMLSVPGKVVELAMANEDLLIAVDDANGGVYRMPRRGGSATLIVSQANLTAMNVFGNDGIALAWTGRAGTSVVDSGVGVMGVAQLQWWFGPFSFPNPTGREITGVLDMPTALPRQFLGVDDGGMDLFSGFSTPYSQPVSFSPPLPVGAATAIHPRGPYSLDPAVLGNSAYPFLYTVDPWSAAVMNVSLGLPGSPVDFAWGIQATAHHVPYGTACGVQPLQQTLLSNAVIGGVLSVAVDASPFLPVLFAAGLDDFGLGVLPAALPGGCELQVSPDVVSLDFAAASGTAIKAINVPGIPALLGSIVHTQWAHFDPAGFSVSSAFANWIGV